MTNFVAAIWEMAHHQPDALATRDGVAELTYRSLVEAAAGIAERVRAAGIIPNDRVLLAVPSSVAFVVAYCGLLAAGAVVVPVNPRITTREAEYIVADADCALVVAEDPEAEAVIATAHRRGVPVIRLDEVAERAPAGDVPPPEPRDPADMAILLYTSGTTGRPKAAILTHGNLAAATTALSDVFAVTADDRIGTALPLFHVFGQVAVLGMGLRAGSAVILQPRYDADALLQLIADDGLTIVFGVPTMWIDLVVGGRRLVSLPDFSALRVCGSGGAPLPHEVARAFEACFGASIVEGYGLSETAAAAAFQRPGSDAPAGSVGPALRGVRIAVVGEDGRAVDPGVVGEITVAGEVVTPGYWRQPDATREALVGGALRTGDLGRLDAEGFLWIVDRKKDLIIRGGHNVYPREVEEVLYEHPAVREAVVVGVPDDRLGEEVAAVVAVVAGSGIGPQELRAWLDERLAAPKVPRLYQLVEEVPKGPTGKLLKRAIDRAQLLETAVRTGSRAAGRPGR